jgi:hypothetical protein
VPRGGKREGAGRKPGSKTRRTRAVAEAAAREGITPLEVMLKAMRAHLNGRRLDQAAAVAKDAAPYMHPRLGSVQHSGPNGGPIVTVDVSKLSDEQLAALEPVLAALAAAGDPAGTGPG